MSERETIDVSSTITTSWGRRWARSWRNRLWLPGRQPRRRWSVDACKCEELVADLGVDGELRGLFVDGLLEPGGGLAGRGCERDEWQRRVGGSGLLGEQRDDRATVVVLPVPGPPATTASRRSTADAAARHWRLSVWSAKRRPRPSLEDVDEHARRLVLAQGREIRGDLALLAPVAIEVEPRAHQPQRARGIGVVLLADRDQRACGDARDPLVGGRPLERREVDRLIGLDGRRFADARQVHVHVRQARRADGERRGEEHRLVVLAGQLGQAERDVDVGRDEHSGLVERAQEPGRAGHPADVDTDRARPP